MKILKSLYFILLTFSITLSNESLPPTELISIPTAGTVDKGSWSLDLHLQKNGGILSSLMIGMTPNFNIGISYGIQQLIGNQRPSINKTVPEVHVKYRVLEETTLYPALVIGLNTQGFGNFSDSTLIKKDSIFVSRYDFKSHGFYVILSKNWNFLGNLGFHIGGSFNSWEGVEEEKIPNILVGIDKDLNNSFTFMADYNFGINDKNNRTYDDNDKWPGFLNTGIRWSISDNLKVELCMNQIKQYQKFYEMNREFKILYRQYF
ncbi:MAG: hypothetical protein CMF96_12595 [Candidatus Marinimicrobia bacterium]|nr:hypothetical protein [Candidatus Neomarinimicrobiota bacterium]|tara:strand:+ start:546 stop:1331 length:786 start_codon:yes stop_codon:yes gene_type:complete